MSRAVIPCMNCCYCFRFRVIADIFSDYKIRFEDKYVCAAYRPCDESNDYAEWIEEAHFDGE